MEEEKQKKLDRLLSLLDPDNALTKKDFVAAFEQVVELILNNEKKLADAISRLEETHQNLTERNRTDYVSGLTDLKKQTNELFVGDRIKQMDDESKASHAEMKRMMNEMIDKKMREMDMRMSEVKNGERGPMGPQGPEGRPPTLIQKQLNEFNDKINKIREAVSRAATAQRGQRAIRAMGRAKVPMPRTIDLTADQNGVARVFTVPPDTVRIFGGISSQFPFAIASGDISRSGNQITLDNTIAPRERGQTLLIFTDALFYP